MKILVTGGSGDIGRELVRELCQAGHEVVVFDILLRPEEFRETKGVTFFRGSVLNIAELLDAFKQCGGVDCVAHLAGLLPTDCEPRPFEAVKVNFLGTASMLEACRVADVRRLVYASSSAVYGYGPMTVERNIDEDFPKQPNNTYAILKYAAELYLGHWTEKYGMEYSASRVRLLMAPRQRPNTGAWGVLDLDRVLKDLLSGKTAVLRVSPDSKIEVTHPDDASKATASMCLAEELRSRAYNVMSTRCTMREIAAALEKSVPGGRVAFQEARGPSPGVLDFGEFDISRAVRELGFKPQYTIDRIIGEIVADASKSFGHR